MAYLYDFLAIKELEDDACKIHDEALRDWKPSINQTEHNYNPLQNVAYNKAYTSVYPHHVRTSN